MSFSRHSEIYPSDGGAGFAANAPAHRLDEFPAGYSSAGWSPPEPTSASPAEYDCAVKSYGPSRSFHRTANCVLTVCVSRGGKRTDGTWIMPSVPVPDLGIWKEWIGSLRMERLGRANLVLLVEEPSANPEILDAVHQRLNKDLSLLFHILHLRAGVEVAEGADLLCGSSKNGVPGIRQMSQLPAFRQSRGWTRAP